MKNTFIKKFIEENKEIFDNANLFINNLIEGKNNDSVSEVIKGYGLYIKELVDKEIVIRDPENKKIEISITYEVDKKELKSLSYMIDLKDTKTLLTEDYISRKYEEDKVKHDLLINFQNKDVVTKRNFSCNFKLDNVIRNKEVKNVYFDNIIEDLTSYVNGVEASKKSLKDKCEILRLSADNKGLDAFLESDKYFGLLNNDNYKILKINESITKKNKI